VKTEETSPPIFSKPASEFDFFRILKKIEIKNSKKTRGDFKIFDKNIIQKIKLT
jgi:hypothetical protein